MKILKSKCSLSDWQLTEFVKNNQIPREDIFSIVSNGNGSLELFSIFYYEEPKPEEKKKGFWG